VKPSSLHVCNLANVAYGYAKILDEFDYPVALRCHDLQHLMSQPEWDDLELCADDFPDENNFFNNNADFGSYRRPEWFRAESILPLKLDSDREDEPQTSALRRVLAMSLRSGGGLGLALARRTLPIGVKTRLYPLINYVNALYLRSTASPDVVAQYLQFERDMAHNYMRLIAAAAQHGPDYAISRQMLLRFQPHAWWLRRNADKRDAVFAYVLAPIYAMLLDDRPWVAIEIGTMRDIPFDGTDIGRLLALAYRRAPHVLITNPDVVKQADRLGVASYSFCPHPLDENQLTPVQRPSALRKELEQQYGADLVIFAPARQNWAIKGNDRYLRAYAELLKEGVRAVLVIPGWGQEVERSKRLCRDLGITERVAWIRPQSEKVLAKYYQAADLVLDQFVLGVFGLTTPKAMACGAIVLTSYDRNTHAWCFPEHPPLVACETEAEIFRAMKALAGDERRRKELAVASRDWVCRYHSKRVIREVLDDAMDKARAAHETGQPVHRRTIRSPASPAAAGNVLLLAGAGDIRACRHTLRLLKGQGAEVQAVPIRRRAGVAWHAAEQSDSISEQSAQDVQHDYAAVWRWSIDRTWSGTLARYSRRYRDRWTVREEDVAAWADVAQYYSSHYFGTARPVLAIGRAAIPAMLCAARPFAAMEIGTSVPHDSENRDDRLQMLAYRTAPVLLATDARAFKSLYELGLERARYLPLPLEPALWDPPTRAERKMFRASMNASFVAFAPLAQDWNRHRSGEIVRGFARFAQQRRAGSDRLPVLILCEGGPDLAATRELVSELGIDDCIRWTEARSPADDARFYRACDVVLDSLECGSVVIENIDRCGACATDLAGAFDSDLLAAMYEGRPPPVEDVVDAAGVCRVLGQLYDARAWDHEAEAAMGRWYPAANNVRAFRERLAERIASARDSCAEFDALRQKRLELRYESTAVDDYDRKYHASAVYCGMDQRLADIVAQAAGATPDRPTRLLDLGCGPGSLVRYLRDIPGVRITGVDLSPEMVRYAKIHHPDVEFHVGDAESIPFDNDSFDVVLCSGMLHHLPRLDVALTEIGRVLKPGGLLVAREPNDDNFAARHGETAFAHLCLRHHLQFVLRRRLIAQPDAHGYHRDFDVSTLAGQLGAHFAVERVYTDLRVAYFYEALASDKEFSLVAPLEETLVDQPGLNIVFVARNEGEGITGAAKREIGSLMEWAPVRFEHFRRFANLLDTLGESYADQAGQLRNEFLSKGWTALVEYFDRQGPVGVFSTDAAQLESAARLVESVLARHGTATFDVLGRPRLITRTIDEARRGKSRRLDICAVWLQGAVAAEDLNRILANIAEYGLLVVETGRGTTVTGTEEERSPIKRVPVLAATNNPDGSATICVNPCTYTALDAVKSLRVAITAEVGRGAGYGENRCFEIEGCLDAMERRFEEQAQWSHLGALEKGEDLLSAIEHDVDSELGEDIRESQAG